MCMFKSGFIGLTGRTNVGKSTLINAILSKNVVITSDKPQTTRDRINCIYNTETAQAVFVDCPGFFKPKDLLGQKLNKIIYSVLEDVDIIVAMLDISENIGPGDKYVIERVKNRVQPKILVLNKTDLLPDKKKPCIADVVFGLRAEFGFFENIIPVSAATGDNIDVLLGMLIEKLPEGPKYFPDGIITDMPAGKMISEIVREKLAENLFDELPHSVIVEVENIEKSRTKSSGNITKIECSIYVEKKSHKPIIIGKSGTMLKKVGQSAREKIEEMLGSRVYLQLWVKVMENWTKNENFLNKLGYE